MNSPADQHKPDDWLDTAWQPASAAERIYSAAEWASTDNCSDPTHHRVLSALTDKYHYHNKLVITDTARISLHACCQKCNC